MPLAELQVRSSQAPDSVPALKAVLHQSPDVFRLFKHDGADVVELLKPIEKFSNRPPALLKQLLRGKEDRSDEVRLSEAVSAIRASFKTLDVSRQRADRGVSKRSNRMIANTLRESEVREIDQVWFAMALDLANLAADSGDEDEDESFIRGKRKVRQGHDADGSPAPSITAIDKLAACSLPPRKLTSSEKTAEELCQTLADWTVEFNRRGKHRPGTASMARPSSAPALKGKRPSTDARARSRTSSFLRPQSEAEVRRRLLTC